HGANRLGGNSLSDLIVLGCRAGRGAADYASGLSGSPRADDDQVVAAFRRATQPLHRDAGENPYLLHDQLQQIMDAKVGIVRHAAELQQGIDQLAELGRRVEQVKAVGSSQYNPGWHEALAMRSLIVVAEAVALSAMTREESRGAHTRLDFDGERDEWLRFNVVVRRADDGRMQVERVARPEPPAELARIAYAKIEDLEREIAAEATAAPRAGR
ncbi:MAG TPA: hypothetical protein VD788_01540, partial [Candidatus Polarisedimenticolaceae bacterium]|nr:hypothetical protein [Candidatus Polarisedimenticolaceae bacterium]